MILLKRMYYTQYRIEQKEYGIGSKIWKTGKKYYNKGKEKLNNYLDTKIKNLEEINSNAVEEINNLTPIKNKKLGRNLAREAHKNGVRIFDKNKVFEVTGELGGKSSIKDSGNFVELDKETAEAFKNTIPISKLRIKLGEIKEGRNEIKVINALNRGGIINLKGKYYESNPVAAHEIGHRINKSGKGLKKIISKVDEKSRGFYPKKLKKNEADSKIKRTAKSIVNDVKNLYGLSKKAIITSMEERNAWKNGIKLMKRSGASKKEIDLARKRAKLGIESYDSVNKRNVLKYIREKSGRGGTSK